MKRFSRQIYAFTRVIVVENIRNKSFFIFISAGCLLFVLSSLLGNIAIGDKRRVFLNSGFWIIGIWGLITCYFLSAKAIQNDIQKKIIYMPLSRAVPRWIYILGKFSGILTMNFFVYISLSILMVLVLVFSGEAVSINIIIALISIFFEWCVLSGLSLLLASFTSPLLHLFLLVSSYVIGHWSSYLYTWAQNNNEAVLRSILILLYYIFPNLESLNFRAAALYEDNIDPSLFIHGFLTMSGWTAVFVIGSVIIFTNRKMV
ncbi:hypothetical protein [Desulfobacter curvatus]|uniref:hypothetical protein n=1 Tax=Desulfobacter curvatus TaxID=2290 RepID=UPI000363F6CC|nr:hypothetical protein [Desulfobacter curvatus]